jgi:hypothetical protein
MKYMRYIKNSCIGLFLIPILLSCSSEGYESFGEQYKKTILIVHSDGMEYVGEQNLNDSACAIQVSVYCASSLLIDHDLEVNLKLDPQALDSLNYKNALGNPLYKDMIQLPEGHYKLDKNPKVIIKKGDPYGVLNVPISLNGLDPDVTYAFPISLVSNSSDYDVNPQMNKLVYHIKFINDFSGDYQGSSTELPKTVQPVQPTLVAMSANSVRLPIHTLDSDTKYLDTNFMVLTIASDGTSVAISPWRNANVKDMGGSTYNKKTHSFILNYSYVNDDGDTVEIREKINNVDYTNSDED